MNEATQSLFNRETSCVIAFAYKTLKASVIVGAVLVLVAMGQFGQYMHSANDLRMKTIAVWRADHPELAQSTNDFEANCLNSITVDRSITDPKHDAEIVSIYKCGERMGAGDLAARIKSADDVLKSAAWPLSMVSTVVIK